MKHISESLPKTKAEFEAFVREGCEESRNFAACESQIEDDFLRCFYKVKADSVVVTGQSICITSKGRYRLDFALQAGLRKIGFECDGKQFHDVAKDEIRDDAILETGNVDVIYRAPGKSLWFHTYELLDLLRFVEPDLFSFRGIRLLDQVLQDDTKREDDWQQGRVIRSLKKPESREEALEDFEIRKYKSAGSVELSWRSP